MPFSNIIAAALRNLRYLSYLYPLTVLAICLAITFYVYRRDQALQAENVALQRTIRQKDAAVETLLKNTDSYVYNFFGMAYTGNPREFVDQNILLYGAYEKYILFLLKDLAHNLDDDHLVFYDIGAYTGQHSLFMSRYAAVVHAFEPYPAIAARFRQMIDANKVRNINLWPIGLGREPGRLAFKLPPAWNPAMGSVTKNWYRDDNNGQISVEIKRGDDLPSDITSDVDLIKLDTEGYEKNIIIGLRDTLRRHRPIIVMELNTGNDERWVSEGDIFKQCPPDYKMLLIRSLQPLSEGRYKLEQFVFTRDASHQQPNVLLFPSEKQNKIPLSNIGLPPPSEHSDAYDLPLWPVTKR